MSKSLGNVLDPFQVIDAFGADALRYYCFREVSFGQDGSVSTAGFEARYDTELANEYGNLASRTLAMIERYRDGVVPEPSPTRRSRRDFDGLADGVARAARPRRADAGARGDLAAACGASTATSRSEAPWKLAKDEAAAERLDEVLYTLAEGLRVVSRAAAPVHAGRRRAAARGARRSEDLLATTARALGARGGGAPIGELEPLFPRIEPPAAGRSAAWSTLTATSTPASRPTPSWSSARARGRRHAASRPSG